MGNAIVFESPDMDEAITLRLSLTGGPGTGKTYTALELATALASDPSRIAVMDSERDSAKRYHVPRGPFRFKRLAMHDDLSPERYTACIEFAARSGFEVLIIDSMSHAWDGLLDAVGGGGKQGWGKVRPVERRFWTALLTFPGHIIATFRVRTAYVEGERDDRQGKRQGTKVAVEAVSRKDTEYEFDIAIRLEDEGKTAIVTKSRCSAIAGETFGRLGSDFIQRIRPWLDAGVRDEAPDMVAVMDARTEVARLRALAPKEWHGQIDGDVVEADTNVKALKNIIGKLGKSLRDAKVVITPGPKSPKGDPSTLPPLRADAEVEAEVAAEPVVREDEDGIPIPDPDNPGDGPPPEAEPVDAGPAKAAK